MGEDTTGPYGTPSGNQSGQRLSVDEAARTLGLSVDAVRKRVQRGTIPYEKDPAGRVTIILDSVEALQDKIRDTPGPQTDRLLEAKDETIEELRSRVRYLEEESRRKDHLLAAALERIPAIEAPSDTAEPRSSTEEQQEPTSQAQASPQEEQRSWWRRMFGG
jgi:excisionase family DNA binding protein